MRLMIATDAWRPQVNGVVRTLERLGETLAGMGVEVGFFTPDGLKSLPCPGYPEIPLALAGARTAARFADRFRPTDLHIATEGPIGLAARSWARRTGMPFTTSYHTRFPEYLSARLPVPERWSYAYMRGFHTAGRCCMVATRSLQAELVSRGFGNVAIWSRGVDTELFRPRAEEAVLDLPRPIFLNVGRVAIEKNLPAFLDLDLPGSKVVAGDGPMLDALRRAYPAVHFTGCLEPEHLARVYAAADVLVFPSTTDTFGNVIVEALACGLPVAGYPVTGPADILAGSGAGVIDRDLKAAALAALQIPRDRARAHALRYSWRTSAEQFLENIERAHKAA